MSERSHTGYVEFPEKAGTRVYSNPVEIITAFDVPDVIPAIEEVASRIDSGYHAAGYIAYEAAPAFDNALQTHPPSASMPLVWFGIYQDWTRSAATPQSPAETFAPHLWEPTVSPAAYRRAIAEIRERIAAGDTYQVNYTFPTLARYTDDALAWFRDRQHAQRGLHSAYLNLGDHEIMSLSPELFFSLNGRQLTSRPMKGTRPRGLSIAQDRALAEELLDSPKERAENLMIVDMLRNDFGRVCTTRSIEVPSLFSIEQYPTVWQMTSTVTGSTDASVPDIFRALFPCASVTGAPKVETMKLITSLEDHPRGVYCGAIGWWAPDRQAMFNVAIRTAMLDRKSAQAVYPVGSGITWDSIDAHEYDECLTKTAVLHHQAPAFQLLASLRLDNDGYFLLEEHLDRLEASAGYFDYPFSRESARTTLKHYSAEVSEFPAKVRLCVDHRGKFELSHALLPEPGPWNVGMAAAPIDTTTRWVYHKTTRRDDYDSARASRPDCTDVILYNEKGCVTEATFANVVVEIAGRAYTPPISDGLLDGVFRRYLLETGAVEERSIAVEDVEHADRVHLINSVRKWIPVNWVPAPTPIHV